MKVRENKMSYRINLENVEKLIQLKNQIKEAQKLYDEIESDFIDQMKKEGIEEKLVGNGKGKVTYKNNPQRRFNQKKFGTDYPDLLEEYKEFRDCWSLKAN